MPFHRPVYAAPNSLPPMLPTHVLVNEVCIRMHQLDMNALSNLRRTVEAEHTQRQAAVVGQQPVYDLEW